MSKIKLAGFKSFVDPTTIYLPSNLIGVVGPNGCGKSNIIDAVRWVMGESSAKYLRGGAMADVIFSGSSARKPVGHAMIELVFDNSDGQVGGQYASYAEIAIKRAVSRDGASQYFLNSTRCRRRDITDIFLGTGLGPRSYAIIEQGTISRLIEAKPDELRVFLEEAAGISKYKERRRETENRIRHTNENIERLNDLRDEVSKQLKHLQRQAKAAERYKELKAEARDLRAGALALHWRDLDTEVSARDRAIAAQETALQSATAEQRRVETALLKCRERHEGASETFNTAQAHFYQAGADVARGEQALKHARELRQRQQSDVEQTARGLREVQSQVARDDKDLQELNDALRELEPQAEAAAGAQEQSAAALTEAEDAMYRWQQAWDEFKQSDNALKARADVERTRIEHLEHQLKQNLDRAERIRRERADLKTAEIEAEIGELHARVEDCNERHRRDQDALNALRTRLSAAREEDQALDNELHALRSRFADGRGRLASLQELQQAALGKSRRQVVDWLRARGWDEQPRLAERIQVDSGWERAVETVLGSLLEAVCLDEVDANVQALDTLADGEVALVRSREGAPPEAGETGSDARLGEKVKGPMVLRAWLGKVYTAVDVAAAQEIRTRLEPDESVITAEGTWLARDWARISRASDNRAGVLAREQQIKTLHAEQAALDRDVAAGAERQEALKGEIQAFETQRETLQSEVNRAHREHADAKARLDARRGRLEQAKRRARSLDTEAAELDAEVTRVQEALKQARGQLEVALADMQALESRRADLEDARESRRAELEQARTRAKHDREHAHNLGLKRTEQRSARESTERSLTRMRTQLTQLETRKADLEAKLAASEAPLKREQDALDEAVEQRSRTEGELGQARHELEAIDAQLRELEKERHTQERAVADVRGELEKLRLASQEIRVRRETLIEQLRELQCEAATVLADLPEDACVHAWEDKLDTLRGRIERLGAINLAAIDEFAEQSERQHYLDAQLVDLSEALATLETAIRKIDKETRARFKETFDRVNAGVQASFPRLFGGGRAYLELTSEELLDAGVSIMARPPGKRNSTINLLSGGEKALTAVALVFAIFELNPAPFCLLDEVDAPLDEANVGRFCDLVRDMSERIQFLFITHNKATMEMARQLTGVTMNEPGVSRLVTVDVDEAARMAVG